MMSMQTGAILRIVMITAGVLIFMQTILSLAKRRLKEQFCLLWGVISLLLVLAGILLRPVTLSQYVSGTGMLLIIVAGGCVVCCLYFLSIQLSVLSRKNQELAMQVSLLNQENERILAELEELKKKD